MLTWFDYARERFVALTASETQAIVAHLEDKQDQTELDRNRAAIDEALGNYWHGRVDSSVA